MLHEARQQTFFMETFMLEAWLIWKQAGGMADLETKE
jgi:hypothetical protein